jgi:UDP-glucose 4-epimerase
VTDGEPVALHGDGEQQRDFVHVDDVADALVRMLDSDRRGLWNVATGSPTSINQLLALIETTLGRTVERRKMLRRSGDVRRSWLSARAIADDLGWKPRISLADGVAALVST